MEHDEKLLNELTVIENLDKEPLRGIATISTEDFGTKYLILIEMIKRCSSLKETLDKEIKEIMGKKYIESGDTKIVAGKCQYTYIPETEKVSVDTAKLKKEFPDIYKQCIKRSKASAALRSTMVADKTDKDKE